MGSGGCTAPLSRDIGVVSAWEGRVVFFSEVKTAALRDGLAAVLGIQILDTVWQLVTISLQLGGLYCGQLSEFNV